MNMNKEKIDSEIWKSIDDECKYVASHLMTSHALPYDYSVSFNELLSEAYWQAMYLANNYREGELSLLNYVKRWCEIRVFNGVWAEYKKLDHDSYEELCSIYNDDKKLAKYLEESYLSKHALGKGEVPSLAVDEREAQETHDIVQSIYDKLNGKDKTIASMYMEGYTLEEIGNVVGLNKATILKRIRKMKNGVQL